VDPHGLPGPRLGELDAAAAAGLWALLAELRRGEVPPRGQLIRLTRRLPVELASPLLSVLDGGPAFVRAEAVRVLEAADPEDPATPALAVIVLGWLEAAEQAFEVTVERLWIVAAAHSARLSRSGSTPRRSRHRRCRQIVVEGRRGRHSSQATQGEPCQRFARNCATHNLASPLSPILRIALHLGGCGHGMC
jgi:hypothetical protein